MEKTFAQLVKDNSVAVQGSHWAALINAHGCVTKTLTRQLRCSTQSRSIQAPWQVGPNFRMLWRLKP
ncbi:hypothetical protein BJV77DRAFT_51371 [Russula vinacea]|nr:hypothetical protein BJV77DRAFT_51371 [Russula vinacea]